MRKLKKSEKTEAIAKIGLFSGLSQKELGFVAQQVTQLTIRAGNVLVTEGDLGREAMLILNGTAVVRRRGRKVATLGPGDVLGEMSLVSRTPRNATVTADSDVTVLLMDAREFSSVLGSNPKIAEKMLRTVVARLVENDRNTI